jgi:hypothetical protein
MGFYGKEALARSKGALKILPAGTSTYSVVVVVAFSVTESSRRLDLRRPFLSPCMYYVRYLCTATHTSEEVDAGCWYL